MKPSTAVAMIVEAHRQGQSAAQRLYDVTMKNVTDSLFHPGCGTSYKEMYERVQAEVAYLTAANEADKELARLVRAMPVGATLERRADVWAFTRGAQTWMRETPSTALIAAGVGQEEEPCPK